MLRGGRPCLKAGAFSVVAPAPVAMAATPPRMHSLLLNRIHQIRETAISGERQALSENVTLEVDYFKQGLKCALDVALCCCWRVKLGFWLLAHHLVDVVGCILNVCTALIHLVVSALYQ